jgi:hypothetical protein
MLPVGEFHHKWDHHQLLLSFNATDDGPANILGREFGNELPHLGHALPTPRIVLPVGRLDDPRFKKRDPDLSASQVRSERFRKAAHRPARRYVAVAPGQTKRDPTELTFTMCPVFRRSIPGRKACVM